MLTDTWLRKNSGKVTDSEVVKADRDGLAARLRKGKMTFIFRATLKGGKPIKMKIADYPAMSLSDARVEARKLTQQVEEGHDPRRLKATSILNNSNAKTVDEIYFRWYEDVCSKNKQEHEQHRRSYEIHIQPNYGHILANSISRRAWVDRLLEITEETPAIGDRLRGELIDVYDHAVLQGVVEDNPIAGVARKTLGYTKGKGARRFTNEEIHLYYRVLNEKKPWNVKNRNFMELLLFYGCRGVELRRTRRSWLNWDDMTWTVPPEEHKTGRAGNTEEPIIRPILPEMEHLWREVLEFIPAGSDFVFPAMETKAKCGIEMMKPAGVQNLAEQMLVFATSRIENEEGNPVAWAHWSNHDLRRTARTNWSKMGTFEVREKMLGHALPGEAKTYDYHHYLEQMIPIYRTWWSFLKGIENGGEDVLMFKTGA